MFQGKALTHRMCCAIIVVKTARAPFEPTEYRQIASSTINTKAQLNTQLKYRNTIHLVSFNGRVTGVEIKCDGTSQCELSDISV